MRGDLGCFYNLLDVFRIFRYLLILFHGKIECVIPGRRDTRIRATRGISSDIFFTNSVFVDPFLKFRPGRARAQAVPGPKPGVGPSQAWDQAGPGPKPGPGPNRARAQAGPGPKPGPGSSQARVQARPGPKPGPGYWFCKVQYILGCFR